MNTEKEDAKFNLGACLKEASELLSIMIPIIKGDSKSGDFLLETKVESVDIVSFIDEQRNLHQAGCSQTYHQNSESMTREVSNIHPKLQDIIKRIIQEINQLGIIESKEAVEKELEEEKRKNFALKKESEKLPKPSKEIEPATTPVPETISPEILGEGIMPEEIESPGDAQEVIEDVEAVKDEPMFNPDSLD